MKPGLAAAAEKIMRSLWDRRSSGELADFARQGLSKVQVALKARKGAQAALAKEPEHASVMQSQLEGMAQTGLGMAGGSYHYDSDSEDSD